VQLPRIPIWVVEVWPRTKSMRRVIRYEGLLPVKIDEDGTSAEMTPADIRDMKAFIEAQCPGTTPFDIVMEGQTLSDDCMGADAIVQPENDELEEATR
jgi:hypothetical protein